MYICSSESNKSRETRIPSMCLVCAEASLEAAEFVKAESIKQRAFVPHISPVYLCRASCIPNEIYWVYNEGVSPIFPKRVHRAHKGGRDKNFSKPFEAFCPFAFSQSDSDHPAVFFRSFYDSNNFCRINSRCLPRISEDQK